MQGRGRAGPDGAAWPEVSTGQPWPALLGGWPVTSAPQLGLRPRARRCFQLWERGGQLFIFLAVQGGGGRGAERADPAGSHTGTDSPGAPERRAALGQAARACGAGASPSAPWGQPAKANSTGQFLERGVGV